MFLAALALGYALYLLLTTHFSQGKSNVTFSGWSLLILWILATIVWAVCWNGFYTLQPNQAAVLVLFGKYTGSDRVSGFRYANPLLTKIKVSLRARNLNMETIKVNDQRGNPIEIAAVVVWRVDDSAQATFDVDNFEHYVSVQSEAALRHMASGYPYDAPEDAGVLSLRGSMDEVSAALLNELQQRVARAGVNVEEARLSHLAYAPEIAGAMLQRQQAEAIVAARTRIVDGAVGIVEMALSKLEQHEMLRLDEEKKAAMVNNLLVVLCGDKTAQPVVHTGTLYT
ncbi:MAG: SPFH domain-containing protein [Phycisphaerae bacterium]|nr:SPFH domain-containing protein [Phycisphaerae bacterium]